MPNRSTGHRIVEGGMWRRVATDCSDRPSAYAVGPPPPHRRHPRSNSRLSPPRSGIARPFSGFFGVGVESSCLCQEPGGWDGCPTWIRTMTMGSKDPCAAITPSDIPSGSLAHTGPDATKKRLGAPVFQRPPAVPAPQRLPVERGARWRGSLRHGLRRARPGGQRPVALPHAVGCPNPSLHFCPLRPGTGRGPASRESRPKPLAPPQTKLDPAPAIQPPTARRSRGP